MLFRIAEKSELRTLFSMLAVKNTVVGPIRTGTDRNGRDLFIFDRVPEFDALRLDYGTTRLPAKRYFLPYKEDLATFHITDGDWSKEIDYHADQPLVLFGLHACDINALNRLDKVLLGPTYPMPYYAAKRRNLFVIGTDCIPRPACFCRSMGTDTVTHGFDLFLTDIGNRYFIEIQSAEAYEVVKDLGARGAGPR